MNAHTQLVLSRVVFSHNGLACGQEHWAPHALQGVKVDDMTSHLLKAFDGSDEWMDVAGKHIDTLEARAFALAHELDSISHAYALLDEALYLDAPKVPYGGSILLRTFANRLNCKESDLRAFLTETYLYKAGGSWVPHAKYVEQGLFQVEPTPRADGLSGSRIWFTPLGVEYLTEQFAAWQSARAAVLSARHPKSGASV